MPAELSPKMAKKSLVVARLGSLMGGSHRDGSGASSPPKQQLPSRNSSRKTVSRNNSRTVSRNNSRNVSRNNSKTLKRSGSQKSLKSQDLDNILQFCQEMKKTNVGGNMLQEFVVKQSVEAESGHSRGSGAVDLMGESSKNNNGIPLEISIG